MSAPMMKVDQAKVENKQEPSSQTGEEKTKTLMLSLSGSELFKFRTPLDKSLPQRGGTKDYAPEGSWLQDKRLEKFYEERLQVLTEPRVQRKVDVVKGEWIPEKKLVEFEREMGRFWIHMGFVDMKRKWLYPVEALFLMETNVLEVWYKGLPLSLQQAFCVLLGDTVTLEEYQVYAHLRRIGFVVLLHQGKLNSTKYVRQIGLDEYMDKNSQSSQKRKHKDKRLEEKDNLQSIYPPNGNDSTYSEDGNKISSQCSSGKEEFTNEDGPSMKKKLRQEDSSIGELFTNSQDMEICSESNECGVTAEGSVSKPTKTTVLDSHAKIKETESSEIMETKRSEMMDNASVHVAGLESQNENYNKTDCHSSQSATHSQINTRTSLVYEYSNWESDEICFPDIGGKETLSIASPSCSLLPGNVTVCDYVFNVTEYLKSRKANQRELRSNEERDVYSLEFSFADFVRKRRKVGAKNWREYKQKLQDVDEGREVTPVAHLWSQEVTPLVKPTDATSTYDILQKLQIIPNAKLIKPSGRSPGDIVKYDVYLPDLNFKKTRPGIPNHRVCVLRSIDLVPDLATIVAVHSYLDDNVPLQWAVVDSGDIAFYEFSNMELPLDVSMG